MDHTEKPTDAYGDQGTASRRRLWDQFTRTLDPHQRKHLHKIIAPRSRKRLECALRNLLIALAHADKLLASSEPPKRD